MLIFFTDKGINIRPNKTKKRKLFNELLQSIANVSYVALHHTLSVKKKSANIFGL